MPRRTVPSIEMHSYGKEHLRQAGIVIVPLYDSVAGDPQRQHPHYHDFFQVSLIQGAARLMHDFREKQVRGTTLFFLRPGQVHTVGVRKGLTGTIISFTQAFFDDNSPPPSKLYDMPFFMSGTAAPWLPVTRGHAGDMAGLFSSLQQEFDQARQDAAAMLRALLGVLLVRAGRLYRDTHPEGAVSRSALLARQFQQEVEHHFREWPSLPPYARLLGVTVNHLNDVISSETGRSAGDLIRQRRLLDAKRLLLHSDLDVAEIGYQLGFDDPSYFGRFFRRYALATPAAFREQIREKYQRSSG